MKKLWSFLINFMLVSISTAAVLILAELSFRKLIFSDWLKSEGLKDPGAYADIYADEHSPIFSNEYWVLYYLFDHFFKPPEHPHPLLGWVGYFNTETYLHQDHKKVNGRRPVLLFGDSFSMCVGARCFEEILNEDSAFASKYYLLNYGVGGYGVDQIYLLSRKVIPLYDDPVVFFGFMTRDLDRNILSFRTGQKPYFDVVEGRLELRGVPIESKVDYYVERNMPDINSYLYRYARNSVRNYVPKDDPQTQAVLNRIVSLNEALLRESEDYLHDAVVDYRYLIFSALYMGEQEWRNLLVRENLERNHSPYLWVKDLIEADSNYRIEPMGFYEDGTNGHPTTYQNQLICDAIKACLFDSVYNAQLDSINSVKFLATKDSYDKNNLAHYLEKIRMDQKWMSEIERKAKERNIHPDSMLILDAQYLLDEFRAGLKEQN